MLAYLVRRLAASLFILLGVSVVTFGLTFLIPADPVAMIAGRNSTPEIREQIRHQLGLNRPVPEQYAIYLGRLLQGDLGKSYARKSDVGELIASRLPPTLLLMLAAIMAELLIGLPAGIYAASRRGRIGDKIAMTLSFASVSTPQFVLGLTLLYLFAYLLNWLPLGGYGSSPASDIARSHLGPGGRRLVLADDALINDRSLAQRLYSHGTRQRHVRNGG